MRLVEGVRLGEFVLMVRKALLLLWCQDTEFLVLVGFCGLFNIGIASDIGWEVVFVLQLREMLLPPQSPG